METRIVSLQEAIDTVLRETIVTYLHAKTETALSTIELIDRLYSDNKQLSSELINRHLLSMQVARSGYMYILDSRGHVVLHPDPATVSRVIPEIEPVRTQLKLKSGFLEYSWQNSFEPLPPGIRRYTVPEENRPPRPRRQKRRPPGRPDRTAGRCRGVITAWIGRPNRIVDYLTGTSKS